MARRNEEYDWLDDPFNDKKGAQQQGMATGTKLALGCGCLAIVAGIVAMLVFALVGVADLASA